MRAVLVLGDSGGLAVALRQRLHDSGVAAHSALSVTDSEASALLAEDRWGAVAVVTREDVLALRLALLSAHVRPDLPLCVTMFDKTIMRELQHVAPAVHALSPSQLAAPALADRCRAAAGSIRSRARAGIGIVDDALSLLVRAGLGLALAFLVETAIALIALHDGLVDAMYFSTRSVATVAGVPGAATAPAWFKVISALDTIAALLLVAVFTAALVRRLGRARLTTLLGPRAAPARGHVILIGFGQVGFRLAQELRRRGCAVLGIERDPDAPCVRLARSAGIPVAIGRGDDRAMLERAGIRRCAAVAAMTSSDLVNVAVGLAARDLAPQMPLVLRLGDGDVAAETDSLLHLGEICDVHAIAADQLAATLQALAGEGGQPAPTPTSA
ncbi:MAG: potassium channel family protein [Solirubrobacteraceae bacterium]